MILKKLVRAQNLLERVNNRGKNAIFVKNLACTDSAQLMRNSLVSY